MRVAVASQLNSGKKRDLTLLRRDKRELLAQVL